jgi:hypothetical protein
VNKHLKRSQAFTLLIIGVLSLSACGSSTFTDNSSSTETIQVDKTLVDSACLLVIGAYESWAELDEQSNAGTPGDTATKNFQDALQRVAENAIDLYGYENLIAVNQEIDENKIGYSDAEVIAGIVNFKNTLDIDSTLKLEDLQPGRNVTFDNFFNDSVKDRCELREGSEAVAEQKRVTTLIASLKAYDDYESMIRDFVNGGGICDVVIDELYCQSNSEEFQAQFWLWDDPIEEIPTKQSDINIIYGQNWELWIPLDPSLNLVSISESMSGKHL